MATLPQDHSQPMFSLWPTEFNVTSYYLPTSPGCLCFHIELKVQKQTKSKGCMLSFVLSRYLTFLICTRPLIKGLNNVWIPYLQVTGGTRQVLFYWELCINYPPWTRESWYFSANPGMTQSWLSCDFDDILAKVTLRPNCLVEYVHRVQTEHCRQSTGIRGSGISVQTKHCATFRASPAETTTYSLHTITTPYSFHHIWPIVSSKYFIMGGLFSGGSS